MAEIFMERDTLDALNAQFSQTPLRAPIFLNSLPKSGTHLLRNILRMFVPVEQQHQTDFIQWPNLAQNRRAFDPSAPKLSWGHLFLADASVVETASTRRVLLYRDPRSWALARARFYLSDQFQGELDHLKAAPLSAADWLTFMIFGVPGKVPSLKDMYELNVVAWLGTDCLAVRYEDLLAKLAQLDTSEAGDYFMRLFDHCQIPLPQDWRARITVGADRRHSATAREKLSGVGVSLPETLPTTHQALLDQHAPGLRALLGYHD